MKILLVEDDEIFAEHLSINLEHQNYIVETVSEADLAWDYIESTNYDLIVLDVNLPDSDGILLCHKLRQSKYKGAILLLTANDENDFKVKGLDAGADDYVVKTCTLDELSARIRALLRRPREITTPVLRCGDLKLDPSACKVFYFEKEISLSRKEYSLLELFLRNPQRIFSSGVLLERLWSFEDTPGEETVRTHIKRLRRKLEKAGAESVIENIYGMGYRLVSSAAPVYESEEILSVPPSSDVQTDVASRSNPQTSTSLKTDARNAAFLALDKFRPIILQRLAVLDQFLDSHQPDQQEQARQVAHKLAGSLGMFGLADGSTLCQDIETILQSKAEPDWIALQRLIQQLHCVIAPVLTVASTDAGSSNSPQSESILAQSLRVQPSVELSSLLVISNNDPWIAALTAIAPMPIHPLPTTELAQHCSLPEYSGSLVLLDTTAFSKSLPWLSVLQQVTSNHPELPIVVLIEPDTFQVRLDIARCAGECILCMPRTMTVQDIISSAIAWYQRRLIAHLHVLAVDDDPMILQTIRDQLTAKGIQVTTVGNPHHAWEILHQTQPDLLLLDFEMPDVNGIELCRIIRADQRWQQLPIIFLSGKHHPELIEQSYRAGADDYMSKPVTESELLTRILNRIFRSRRFLV